MTCGEHCGKQSTHICLPGLYNVDRHISPIVSVYCYNRAILTGQRRRERNCGIPIPAEGQSWMGNFGCRSVSLCKNCRFLDYLLGFDQNLFESSPPVDPNVSSASFATLDSRKPQSAYQCSTLSHLPTLERSTWRTPGCRYRERGTEQTGRGGLYWSEQSEV